MTHDDPWPEYTRIQAIANSTRLSSRTWAAEEALGAILDKIETRQNVSARQTNNLLTNRARTTFHRHRLLARHAHLFAQPVDENRRLEARSELGRYRQCCTVREWRVLYLSGLGYSYDSIASTEGVPEATVKTWVRRIRLKLDRTT